MAKVVTLDETRKRLDEYIQINGDEPRSAAFLAGVVWPGREFSSERMASAAISRILKQLGWKWIIKGEGKDKVGGYIKGKHIGHLDYDE